jgi:hypothetical protein
MNLNIMKYNYLKKLFNLNYLKSNIIANMIQATNQAAMIIKKLNIMIELS